MYYAHSGKKDDKSDWQYLKDHLEETAKKSREFASKFNQGEIGRIAGLLHDLGKYSKKFQEKITQNPKIKVIHATAGAKEAIKRFELFGEAVLVPCIAGHHGGLKDTNDLKTQLQKEPENYQDYKKEIPEESLSADFSSALGNINSPFALSFLIRMLYSSLVDADWLNSAGEDKKGPIKVWTLRENLKKYLKKFDNPKEPIHFKRNKILQDCINKAKEKKGLYSLTVPTGGGKTFSSLAFAMEHAVKQKMDRIIYAIPYTSIIEQNAQVFRVIFGNGNVLEHHSNYIFEENETDDEDRQEITEKLKKASENWDMPIIATTNVQFFESLFANKKSKCRKLHNIVNSVIILDEAQMIPAEYLTPCVNAIAELVNNYNCTVVLCTATQPALDEDFKKLGVEVQEIIPNPQELFETFKRVSIESIGKKSDDEIITEISELEQVLVIVNTKKHALELYKKFEEQEGLYHLSTFMFPKHRKQVIQEIKDRLNAGLPTKVISTQLIEAGVDIDFPVVYRSSAGLDSIAQSAGRCNREGKLRNENGELIKGKVYVFESEEKHGMPHGSLKLPAQVGRDAIKKHSKDLLSTEAIEYYFRELYFYKGEQLDANSIMKHFIKTKRGNFSFEFRKAAQEFRFINENTYSIVIPFDENARQLIEKIKYADYPKKYLRQLQPYTVSLYKQDYDALLNKEEIKDITAVMLNPDVDYDMNTGVVIDKESKALFA